MSHFFLFLMIVKGTCTVLCKSNAHVFRQNLWLFLAFQRKNIEFSIEGNFLWKVMIIRNAYCFQLREFSNDNALGTKIDFEFSSEKSLCLINTSNIWTKFRSLLALLKHSQAFCGRQFVKFKFAVMILFCSHLTMGKLVCLRNRSIRLTWIYFKGFLYCSGYVISNAALTQQQA